MRLQDELVALDAIADPSTRKYILGQVPRLPVHFDSQELAVLIERGCASPDHRLAARALAAWDQIGPKLTLHAYGLDPGRPGLWSAVAMQAAGESGDLGATGSGSESVPDASAQRAVLAQVLAPVREPVLALATRPGRSGEHARQVLALVPFEGAEEALVDGAQDPGRAVGALLALARRDGKLAAATIGRLKRLPPWTLAAAAGAVGGKTGLAVALDAARSGDDDACWAAADALPELMSEDWTELGRTLAKCRSGWVPVAFADALGRLAGAAASRGGARIDVLKLLDDTIKNASHDLVRIMAVRAMGGFRHELSVRRAMKCLERGSPLLQAAAIEALVRLEHRPPQLAAELARRAAQGTLKLRGTAVLGLMTIDRDAALRFALDLVSAGDAASRVEGAYALGYLHCPTSIELLGVLAREDPFVPAALQAQKSLAHYPEERVAGTLIGLLAHPEPAVATTALRVLSHYPGEAQTGVVAAIETLEKRAGPKIAAIVLSECGRLGPAITGLPEFLARPRSDPRLRAGALEGLIRSGRVPADLARTAASDRDGTIAIRGALALLVAGDVSGAPVLARWLADDRYAQGALSAVLDLAVIAGEAGRGGHHARLQKLLGGGRQVVRAQAATRPSLSVSVVPVRVRDTDEAIKQAVGVDAPALVARVAAVLQQPAARPSGERARRWPEELSYIHGLPSWLGRLEPYRSLIPGAVVVLILALVMGVRMATAVVAPEQSGSVQRDNLLGKVGSHVELAGKVNAVEADKQVVVVTRGHTLTVRVWLPGIDLRSVKIGDDVAVTGLVKDTRADGSVVVHGFSIKEQ